MDNFYPAGPHAVPASLTRPSKQYKRQAWLAVLSLALFLALYLALAGWFVRIAYRLLSDGFLGGENLLADFTIGSGAAFLAVFMLKGLFFVKRGGAPDAVEISEAEQPALFRFLRQLADEAGAPRPHKVYLSARVNAAVFYDISLLNLLLPSKKNLEIGLALVNVLTLSEMKAVLAHEFGHFAQRSMAIGRWVYITQQIAEQIVAKRDRLDEFLSAISRFDIRIAWVGWLMSLVVWSIRSLLDTVFRVVVLAQRALSRQMEFQADLVAVSLTGSDELVHALHKLQAADDCWSRTIDFANTELQEGRATVDLFAVQRRLIDRLGEILDDREYGQRPAARASDPAQHRVFSTAFAQPPQMWSTHPANADREENAKQHYLHAPHDERSAWLLFDDVASVKRAVIATLTGPLEASPASEADTMQALEKNYNLLRYNPRYRGAYLGRPLTRHADTAASLYQQELHVPNITQALVALYPAELKGELDRLRELEEELATLQALQAKVFKPTGSRIVHRGRQIARRDLPRVIAQVIQETEQARERILAHDKRCRSIHLAAAGLVGHGWADHLRGQIAVLHYAEHTLADLRDAQGLVGNVVAVITADGRVSESELKRLLVEANKLHALMAAIHAQKGQLQLDSTLLERLQTASWSEMLEDYNLPPASNENINDWMRVIDGWVNSLAACLTRLHAATLEQLLLTEQQIAEHIQARSQPDAAPAASSAPESYATLKPGQERKRQTRLGWWDRFQTADGLVPALGRLAVAGTIVGGVLGFSSSTGLNSTLSIYNGLGRSVDVKLHDTHLTLAPYSATQIELPKEDMSDIVTTTREGVEIEHFKPELGTLSGHFVYNVAGASPLVKWTAVYGSAAEQEPQFMGAPRWTTARAEVYFAEPPRSISSKGGGGTVTVLSGTADLPPEKQLKLVPYDSERATMILAHARWDDPAKASTADWQALAKQAPMQ
ncbi:M48 family metallopeptidase [Andreprevotia sp. IGB-42]|uniref:M48 family metallopeptidase n=1 Tax=Andreprevotia sp. IGB-42 TaxID=2497473 RepID=UPI00135ADBDC|nr:M48 family metallopeptidase [Andreprevotia sp. IGB-42]